MCRHLHKTDPKFNYKLYFIQNSHYDVILTTQYNLWLNQLAVFQHVQKISGEQKMSVLRCSHKMSRVFKRGLYLLCNTTCD